MSGPFRPPGFRDIGPSPAEQETKYSLHSAFEKAARVIEKESIKETDFADLYGSENVTRDAMKAVEVKTRLDRNDSPEEKEAAKLATVLEAVIHTQVNNNQWFGRYAKSLRSTKYDDLVNGIDGITEFKVPQIPTNYLALGIDITYRSNMGKKFDRIKAEIDEGTLATIKYLRSSDKTVRSEVKQVPRLVVGVDGQTCQALAKAWYEDAPGLKTNPVRFQIVKEMHLQLETFAAYAKKAGKPELAEKYLQSLNVVTPLLKEMEKQYANFKHEIGDRSSQHIADALEEFK